MPPLAVILALYATPVLPLGKLAAVTLRAAAIVIMKALEALSPFVSVICALNIYISGREGTPDIRPVVLARVRPGGKPPDAMDHV